MRWIPTLALLAAAALAGCDRPPSSAPAPKAGPDNTEQAPGKPASGGASIGPGKASTGPG